MLDNLKRERTSLIMQVQDAVHMENFTSVAYLIGKLGQVQESINAIEEGANE